MAATRREWHIRGRVLDPVHTLVMGVINVTPDSFYDGGRFLAQDVAIEHGRSLAKAGADILDIGGESSRPGSLPVGETTEKDRIIPVVRALAESTDVPISVDTTKSRVAEAAAEAGAAIINDISGFSFDPDLLDVARERRLGLVAMHMRGIPATMQDDTDYHNLFDEIDSTLDAALEAADTRGVDLRTIAIDPGIGFGKDVRQNLRLLMGLGNFSHFGRPILVGPSRKSFLGAITDRPPEGRLFATAAAVTAAVLNGANIVRVHDVDEMRDVTAVCDALLEAVEGD